MSRCSFGVDLHEWNSSWHGVITMPFLKVSWTPDHSRRFVAVDAAEELDGSVVQLRLVVGSADDRAVTQEGEIPAAVLMHLDCIEAGVCCKGFPRHLPHEVGLTPGDVGEVIRHPPHSSPRTLPP